MLQGLGAAFVLVIGLLAFVFYTATGTGVVLGIGLSWYDDAIPGHATVDAIEGSLATALTLRGVRLADRNDDLLASADVLELDIDYAGLTGGVIGVDRIALAGVEVTANGAWGDLGPESTEPEEPEPEPEPDAGLGPDLPELSVGALEIDDGEVWLLLDGERSKLVSIAEIDVAVSGDGHDARGSLAATKLELPAQHVEIDAFSFGIAWKDPVASLSSLSIEGSPGKITIAGSAFDASDLGFDVEGLDIGLDPEWLHAELPAVPPGLRIDVEGSAEHSRPKLVVRVTLPHGPSVTAELDGVPTERGVVVGATLECDDCGAPGIAAKARIDAAADQVAGSLAATFAVQSGAISVSGTASKSGSGELAAVVAWNADDLVSLEPLLQQFDAAEAAHGSTAGLVVCQGTLEPRKVRCTVEAAAALLEGSEASLRADAALMGDTVEVTLSALSARVPRAGIDLVEGPAHVTIVGDRVEVRGLALRDTQGRGGLTAEGVLDLKGNSDLTVHAQALDLSAVRTVVPGLKIDGTLSADVHASGTREDFAVAANVRGRGLAYDGIDIGTLKIDAHASPTSASAKVFVRDGMFGRVSVDASVPLAVGAESVALAPGPIRATVDVENVQLERLRAIVPSFEGRGRVHARARLSGTLARPKLALDVEGRELAWAKNTIGDVDLETRYAEGRVVAELRLDHPAADTVLVEADAPVRVDLAKGRFAWEQGGRHHVRLRAWGIELEDLREHIGKDVGGRVDVDVAVHGGLADPTIDGFVAAQGISFEGKMLGNASARLHVEHGRTSVRAIAQGPLVDGVKLTGHAPLGVDLLAGRPKWDRTAMHHVELEVEGVHLDRLSAFVPGVALAGSLDSTVTLRGAATAPHIDVWVGGKTVGVDGFPLGAVDVEASYRDGTARVDATTEHGDSTVRVRATAPVDLDLAAPRFHWSPDGHHELLAEVRGVEHGDVERWVSLPEGMGFRADADLSASGTRTDFKARAAVRSRVEIPGKGPDAKVEITASATEDAQHVELRVHEGKHARVLGKAALGLDVPAVIDGKAKLATAKIDASVRVIGLQLARLGALLPSELYDPRGVVASQVSIRGTLNDPKLDGHLRIDEAGLTIVPWQRRLEDIGVRLDFSNDRIVLSRFAMRSGKGRLGVSGRLDIRAGHVRGKIVVDADRFAFRQPPLPSMLLTADVTTAIDVTVDRTKIGVRVADSRLEMLSLSGTGAKAIPTNSRVRYESVEVAPPDATPATAADAPAHALTATLEIVQPLEVRGPFVNMEWDGAFQLATAPKVSVAGGVRAEPVTSTFDLLGTEFALERGQISMGDDGDLVPFIDIRGKGTVGKTTVYAEISGRVTQPKVHFFSDPPREELEVITMILTGTDDVVGADSDVSAQAASALAAFTAPALQQSVGEGLGVDTVRLSFGESLDEPIVSVGKNIKKKVYTEGTVHVNAPPRENRVEVMLRYRFLRQWAYEVFTGDARSGMGVWWIRMFDVKLSDGKPSAD